MKAYRVNVNGNVRRRTVNKRYKLILDSSVGIFTEITVYYKEKLVRTNLVFHVFLPPYGLNGRKSYGKETNPYDSPRFKIVSQGGGNVKCFLKNISTFIGLFISNIYYEAAFCPRVLWKFYLSRKLS